MDEITPQILLNLGFHEFSWNGGIIMAYWLPLSSENPDFNYRLSIRFGEHVREPINVWLITSSMLKLPHVDTVDKVIQLYALLTGIPLTKCQHQK